MNTQDYVSAATKLEKYATCFQFVNKSGPFEVIPEMLQLPLPERYNLALSALDNPTIHNRTQCVLLVGIGSLMKMSILVFFAKKKRFPKAPNNLSIQVQKTVTPLIKTSTNDNNY